MRTNWLIGAGITFLIGFFLSTTFIGAFVGIPLIIISIFILFIAFILPSNRN